MKKEIRTACRRRRQLHLRLLKKFSALQTSARLKFYVTNNWEAGTGTLRSKRWGELLSN